MRYVDEVNTTALEYSKTATPFMQQMLEPVHCLNYSGFTYVRVFRDGRRLHLSSNENWTATYLENRIQDSTNSMEMIFPPSYVQQMTWDCLKDNKLIEVLRGFGIGNELIFLEHQQDSIETFAFTKSINNSVIDILNDSLIFKDFMKEFKIRARELLDFSDQRKLVIPSPGVSFDKIDYTSYVEPGKICDFLNCLEQQEYPRQLQSFN